jgi:hypothetical protein
MVQRLDRRPVCRRCQARTGVLAKWLLSNGRLWADRFSACDQTLQIVLRACRYITPTFMPSRSALYTIGGLHLGHGLSMDQILKAVDILSAFFYKELIDTLSMGISRAFTRSPRPTAPRSALGATISTFGNAVAGKNSGRARRSGNHEPAQNHQPFSLNILLQPHHWEVVLLIWQIMQSSSSTIRFRLSAAPSPVLVEGKAGFQAAIKWLQNFIAVQPWGLSFAPAGPALHLLHTAST